MKHIHGSTYLVECRRPSGRDRRTSAPDVSLHLIGIVSGRRFTKCFLKYEKLFNISVTSWVIFITYPNRSASRSMVSLPPGNQKPRKVPPISFLSRGLPCGYERPAMIKKIIGFRVFDIKTKCSFITQVSQFI